MLRLLRCWPRPARLTQRAPSARLARRAVFLKDWISALSPLGSLFGFWALLYGPYILFGGFLRDDLGFLTQPRGFERYLGWLDQPRGFVNYTDFQVFVSSFPTMTGRPVSAILHGLCYWFLGTTIWSHHMINLLLFLASVLFIYRATKNVTSHEIAYIAAVFALIYPSASGTVFSSIMMNSNLAAVFWSVAVYLDSMRKEHRGRWNDVAVALLLVLSSLSYEAFIPLFTINLLIRIANRNEIKLSIRRFLKEAAPVLTALLFFGFYRGFAEKIIFENSVARIRVPSLTELISRFLQALGLGVRESLLQSLKISVNSAKNLHLLSLTHLLIVSAGLIVLGVCLYSCLSSNGKVSQIGASVEKPLAKRGFIDGEIWRTVCVLLVAILMYLVSYAVFVFSVYMPDSRGFESRTQGAIRFAVSFLIGVGAGLAYRFLGQYQLKHIIPLGVAGLFVLFTLSIVGQREAWISAARYNGFLLQKMDAAIRRSKLNEQKTFTFIADLPAGFSDEVNGEPTFGETWDIAPALSLLYPASNIRANVYEPLGTRVRGDHAVFHGYWKAKYPFYFYRFSDDSICLVRGAQDLRNLVPECASK